nr:tautomerase family protein [Brachybacterium sp. Marseille-Q7125]
MRELFAAPLGDRYQTLETLPVGSIIAEDAGLGIDRSDGVPIVQIVQQGRSMDQKQTVYGELARRLSAEDLVRPEGLIISVVSNDREDWPFGRGRAQFLTGEL